MKTVKLLAATLLLGSLAGPFSASPALANDGKAYPGSLCVPWGDNRHPTYSAGAIGNPSTTEPLFIDCPVVKDNIASWGKPYFSRIEDGWVRMIDEHYTDDIACEFQFGVYLSEWYMQGSGRKGSTGSGASIQHVYFPIGKIAQKRNHAYLSCVIPPAYEGNVSYITSYYLEED